MRLKIIHNNLWKFLTIFIFLSPVVLASDNVYIINENKLSKNNDYTVILNEKINLHEIDNNGVYLSTANYLYLINSITGNIDYKIKIFGINKITLSDNYIFVASIDNVYQVNKVNGIIESKYNLKNNDIFTLLNISTSGNTIINNITQLQNNDTLINNNISQLQNNDIQQNIDINTKVNKTNTMKLMVESSIYVHMDNITAQSYYNGFPPSNMNDSNVSTFWEAYLITFPIWVGMNTTSKVTLGNYTIRSYNLAAAYYPTTWLFQGSLDNGANWITLDYHSGETFGIGQNKSYNIIYSNRINTSRYRIYITAGQTFNDIIISDLFINGIKQDIYSINDNVTIAWRDGVATLI